MNLSRCEKVDHNSKTLRYEVDFSQDELRAPSELAYGFLYRDAGIDPLQNEHPYETLVELLGEEAITGYLGSYLPQYIAGLVAEQEDVEYYGTPVVMDVSEDDGSGLKTLSIEYRKIPYYELSEYGPVRVVLPPGEFDDEEKIRRLFRALLDRFRETIKADDIAPALDEATNRFFKELERRDMSVEEYCKKNNLNDERLHQLIFEQTVEGFKEDMALDAICRHEGLVAEPVDERVVLLQIEPDRPEGLRKQLEDTHALTQLRIVARRQRARRWLMETVEFVEDKNVVDVSKMSSAEALDFIRDAVKKMEAEAKEEAS